MRGIGRLGSVFPVIEWLPAYDKAWLRHDLVAGATVAASVVPEGLAYAALANLPPVTGLYAGLLATATYVAFGTSRQVIVGPTAALAVLLATGVGSVASAGTAPYATLVLWTTVLVGVFAVLARLLRLGVLVHFISDPVLTGFSAGAALYIAATQLGPLVGMEGVTGGFASRLWYVGTHLGAVHGPTLALGVGGVLALAVGRRLAPRAPTALLVVLGSIILVSVADLQARGVAVVGPIPGGLPPVAVPALPATDTLASLVPVAGALFLLSYVQGIGAVETFARKHGDEVDANQELLATGVANLAAGFGGGFAVGGSMSRSALNDAVGGKTQVASAVVAAALVVVLVAFAGLFQALPNAILAAVVIVAVSGLVDLDALVHLYAASRAEFVIAMATLLGVLALGILPGVFVGVFLSLLALIARVTDPVTDELARIPGTDHFVDRVRHPATRPVAGVLVYRADAPLFYANAKSVRRDLLDRLDSQSRSVALVVFDLHSAPTVDVTAADVIADLADDLDERGADLRVAGANAAVCRRLRASGVTIRVDAITDDEPVSAVIDRWMRSTTGDGTDRDQSRLDRDRS